MTQPPHDPRQPYYIPVKSGPSAGKVIIWLLVIFLVIIPVLLLIGFLVLMQLG